MSSAITMRIAVMMQLPVETEKARPSHHGRRGKRGTPRKEDQERLRKNQGRRWGSGGPQESEPYGQLLDDYTNIRDVQQAVRHRIQVTENTSFDYSLLVQNTVGHTG